MINVHVFYTKSILFVYFLENYIKIKLNKKNWLKIKNKYYLDDYLNI